jgi:hypothetical protein
MTAIYHITHLDNLAAILHTGALLSDTLRAQNGLAPRSIAHAHIKDRRATTPIPIAPGGRVADYVPFYFCPRSPMLYANFKGMAGTDGQQRILHLVTTAEAVERSGLRFCFADAHAVTQPTRFYDNLQHLGQLPWDCIRARLWNDTPDRPDRKRRKQAEFLVHERLPWGLIERIGVCDAVVQGVVQARIAGAARVPPVQVHGDWYYS